MTQLESEAVRTAIDYLRKTGGLIRTLKIVGTVFGAGLVAAGPWVEGLDFTYAASVAAGMLFVGLLLVSMSSLALVFFDQPTPEIIEENLKVLREAQKLRAQLDYATFYQDHLLARITVNSQVNKLVEEAVSKGCTDITQAGEFAYSILSVFVERRQALFGIGDEYWNFGVYMFNADTNRLVCIACRRDRKEEEDANHREWEPGNGHVGLAFSRGVEIIFADATVPELRPVLEATGSNHREYDYNRYKSLASIPISTDGTRPLGVLIATSNRAGRFKSDGERTDDEWENAGSLREVAESLAIILKMAHSSRDHGGQIHDSDIAGGTDGPS